jgi:hypothetical protein
MRIDHITILLLAGIIVHTVLTDMIIGMICGVVTGTIVGAATIVIVAESIIEPIVLRFDLREGETIELERIADAITTAVVIGAER